MFLKTASWVIAGLLVTGPSWARSPAAEPPRGTVVDEPFTSTVLRDNRIGLNPERAMKVYLPPGYAKSGHRYPVVYFLHNAWWSPRQAFQDGRMQLLL